MADTSRKTPRTGASGPKQKKTSTRPRTGISRKRKKVIVRSIILIALIALALFFLTPTERPEPVPATVLMVEGTLPDIELPASRPGDIIVRHPGYTLSYSEDHEQPWWVAYELTAEEVHGLVERGDDFRADPTVPTGSATPADYTGSGYDRGHLIPAADLSWSEEAMSGSFYMSNMSPQAPQLNRGMWSALEAIVRQNAVEEARIAVVTGPVLTDGPYETIGKNNVAVPKQYYKVLLDYTGPTTKAIGFLLPNEKPSGKIQDYVVAVDVVENVTGLDFFPRLPDDIEDTLEGTVDADAWSWNRFSASAAQKKAFMEALPADGVKDGKGTLSVTGSSAASGQQSQMVTQLQIFLYDTMGILKKELLLTFRDLTGIKL